MMDWLKIGVGVLGGLALFLYGMKIMGDGLEKVAGSKMQKIIESLTGNILKGVLVGAGVTAIIQSSSATTVMVVGFVSAGIMTLKQAVGVIMGANIGTTVTAIILSLGGMDTGQGILELLKPEFLMYVLVIIGIFLIFNSKSQRKKDTGEIVFGLGVLFIGMSIMSTTMKQVPTEYFEVAFSTLASNPILGIIVGAAVTALIQSSSASIGILLAVSQTGMVVFSGAVPIILGQNIGTCVTALISSIGGTKNAKKTATIHLLFNIIGTLIFMILIYSVQWLAPQLLPFWNNPINEWYISIFHLVFNILNTLLLLPFSNQLIKLVEFIVRNNKSDNEEDKLNQKLDDRFLYSPTVALAQCKTVMIDMMRTSVDNVKNGAKAIESREIEMVELINKTEKKVDAFEVALSKYLIKITDKDLTEEESKVSSGYMHMLTDIERISDHAKNLGEYAIELEQRNVDFTEKAQNELTAMFEATFEIMELCINAFINNDKDMIKRVQPYEDVIDLFTETLKIKHINRLTKHKCTAESGIIFVEIINNIERIADHCANVAITVYQLNTVDNQFDPHEYVRNLKHNMVDGYDVNFKEFQEKYYNPVM